MATEAVAAASGASATSAATRTTSIADMTGYDFLQLLITELTSQDPLDPMDNKEILDQLSAIRSLESNMQLSENFKSLLNSQGLVTATALIGQLVAGIDTQGQLIEGKVERVMLDASGLSLQIGDHTVPLSNVMNIAADLGEANSTIAQPESQASARSKVMLGVPVSGSSDDARSRVMLGVPASGSSDDEGSANAT